jgi:hypothetical protein
MIPKYNDTYSSDDTQVQWYTQQPEVETCSSDLPLRCACNGWMHLSKINLRSLKLNKICIPYVIWPVRGSNPGGSEIFRTRPNRPWAHPNSYTMGNGSLSRECKAAGAWCWPPTPILRRGSRKCTAVTILPIWAFVACSRLNFTFTFTLLLCHNYL